MKMIKKDTFNEAELREQIVELALLQQKKVYKHGGHGPDMFDCAGFVWYVYNQIMGIDAYKDGYGISTTTRIMTSSYGTLNLYDEHALQKDFNLLKEGDILLFHRQAMKENKPAVDNKYPGHCGIYLGDHSFIHCSGTKRRVVINNFDHSDYWKNILIASKDYISDIKILEKKSNI